MTVAKFTLSSRSSIYELIRLAKVTKFLVSFLKKMKFPASVNRNSSALHHRGPIIRFDAAAARPQGRQIDSRWTSVYPLNLVVHSLPADNPRTVYHYPVANEIRQARGIRCIFALSSALDLAE